MISNTPTTATSTSISVLYPDILTIIVSYSAFSDLAAMRRTCKTLCEAVDKLTVHFAVFGQNAFDRFKSGRFPKIRSLALKDIAALDLSRIPESLTRLLMNRCHAKDGASLVGKILNLHLVTVNLADTSLSRQDILTLAKGTFTTLNLDYVHNLVNKGLIALAANRTITELSVRRKWDPYIGSYQFSKKAILAVANSTTLQRLDFSNMKTKEEHDIAVITKNRSIHTLRLLGTSLSWMSREELPKNPILKKLHISSDDRNYFHMTGFVKQLSKLEVLIIDAERILLPPITAFSDNPALPLSLKIITHCPYSDTIIREIRSPFYDDLDRLFDIG